VRLGLNLGYWGSGPSDPLALAKHADSVGFDSVWIAEAYGSDALTPLAWVAASTERIQLGTAILQMAARTPALTAMSAATLDHLSGGRVVLGLGASGPQVVEGWHGQPYGKPLERTREYVSIVRTILRRESRLEHHGEHYDIPYSGQDATGLGKPLKLIVHPRRADIPIYLAAIGPRNVALAAEIADGWLPMLFSPLRFDDVYLPNLKAGFEQTNRPDLSFDEWLAGFDIAASAPVVVGEDVEACRALVKPFLALYIGGMGAREHNFYNDLARRYGYEEAATVIQDHYLAGHKEAAVDAVPNELVDEVALIGPRERIAERLETWRSAPVTTLVCRAVQPEALELMAELVL
jgi:F420-dependent oxidoreductase-like protein